ncbi:hypothetical protein, partial [Flavobacterium psychrophilum]|uniref:hypothetical protein n=1 Tax=Flavobacterium psychrophilum TaxID=96345 RepID=UPI001C557B5C
MNNTFNISPTLLVAHLHFCHYTIPTQKNTKEQPSQRTKTDHNGQTNTTEKTTPYNTGACCTTKNKIQ